jgi:hypothetical protein
MVRRSNARALAWAALACALAAASARSGVLVVDASGGGSFTDLVLLDSSL